MSTVSDVTAGEWVAPVILAAAGVVIGLAVTVPRTLVVLAIAVGLVAWIWLVRHDAVTALAVFIALLPLWTYLKFAGWPQIPVPGTEAYVLTLLKEIALGIWFLNVIVVATQTDRTRFSLPTTLVAFLFALFVFLPFVSLRRFPFLFRSYMEMFLLVTVPLLLLSPSREDIHRLLLGFLVGGGSFAVFGLYHYFVDPTFLLSPGFVNEFLFKGTEGTPAFLGPRLQSIAANPNNLGMLTLLTSVVALGLLHREAIDWPERAIVASVLVLSSFTLFLTRSRDDIGFLVLAFGLFVVIYRRILPIALGAVAGAGGLFVMWEQIIMVFRRLVRRGNPRFDKWAEVIEQFGVHVLVGGRSSAAIETFAAPDSTYISLLLQLGIVGLCLFVLYNGRIIGALSTRSFRAPRYDEGTILVVLVVLACNFVFRTAFFNFPFTLYYWMFVAFAASIVGDSSRADRTGKRGSGSQ